MPSVAVKYVNAPACVNLPGYELFICPGSVGKMMKSKKLSNGAAGAFATWKIGSKKPLVGRVSAAMFFSSVTVPVAVSPTQSSRPVPVPLV